MSTPSLDLNASPGFRQWLADHDVSLALTTYQSNRLILIGRSADGERLALNERLFDSPMGLFHESGTLTVTCRYQLWQLANRLPPGKTHEGGDQLYVPRQSWITGDVNAHEVVIDREGHLLFVNTDFSCLATLDPDYSFRPVWQPPFITRLVAEDRCHLNGLALHDGVPTFMTACSGTDTAAGWRDHRVGGGLVMHLPSNQIIATGLSMPHSPRWHGDRLWLLNSGSGEIGYLDGERFVPVTFVPGFARGLAFHGDFAVVGLSKLRSAAFTGLVLEERLAAAATSAQCGIVVFDLKRGEVAEWLYFGSVIEELFDIVLLQGARQPRALGLQDDAIQRLVTLPGHTGLMATKPAAQRPSRGPAAPVAGLPRVDPGSIHYQRVFNLTAHNLLPYDAFTHPRLSTRWVTQPRRGELLGISAAINGHMVGMAIAETWSAADGTPNAEVVSLFVEPVHRNLGIADRLMHELRTLVGVPLSTNLLER
jgi:uncharacterized protein (TIGR03032 family)